MRVLILGGSGMIGHSLYQNLTLNGFETFITLRKDLDTYLINGHPICDSACAFHNLNALYPEDYIKLIKKIKPNVVINALGVINKSNTIHNLYKTVLINSAFPHYIHKFTQEMNCKFIQITTDCVYSGKKGNYRESDVPDPVSFYGRSKLLGDICSEGALTLRISTIGRELFNKYGLLEWFLASKDSIMGYDQAIYSGFPTNEFSSIVVDILNNHSNLEGLFHISSDPISKYELLLLLKNEYKKNIDIIKDDSFQCDRSLNSDRYRKKTGFKPSSWIQMIKTMVKFDSENKSLYSSFP
jgi:dTDP-4-dehydrorhamnose reductase